MLAAGRQQGGWVAAVVGRRGAARAPMRCMQQGASDTRAAPEQHDVRLWSVDGVVDPSTGLLHAQATPLVLHGASASGAGCAVKCCLLAKRSAGWQGPRRPSAPAQAGFAPPSAQPHLFQEPTLGQVLRYLLGQDDVPAGGALRRMKHRTCHSAAHAGAAGGAARGIEAGPGHPHICPLIARPQGHEGGCDRQHTYTHTRRRNTSPCRRRGCRHAIRGAIFAHV